MAFSYGSQVRREAVCLAERGLPVQVVAEALAVHKTTVYAWLRQDSPHVVRQPAQRCWRCWPELGVDLDSYTLLLGLYLGDGWLARTPTGSLFLSIACADDWPGPVLECEHAMRAVLATSVSRVRRAGCHDLKAYSNHWICLFPQHAPGKKHERRILLEPWQQQVVTEHPGPFLRGLFHSDGWRGLNVAVNRAADGSVTRYRYPRYEFTNKSEDIRRLCTEALDLLGIAWRPNGAHRISVNRREAVAALDQHVGPKYRRRYRSGQVRHRPQVARGGDRDRCSPAAAGPRGRG